jgi:pilus assembly protein TadC
MGIAKQLANGMPGLKNRLRMAGMRDTPEQYVGKALSQAVMMALMLGVLAFFFAQKNKSSMGMVLLVFLASFFLIYTVALRTVDARISRRAKEIDKDVLFAGRFLLIKLNSGRPLLSALTEAAQSYGVANHVFKEILRDIDLGTPLETALENSTKFNPSHKMRRILFQITNALKIGIDVTGTLQAVLEEITNEQLTEIQRYGKKLNSFTMFYMLLAIVLPSLGMTLFIVVASLTSISVGPVLFFAVGIVFLFIQIIFITLFRAIRPAVNL